ASSWPNPSTRPNPMLIISEITLSPGINEYRNRDSFFFHKYIYRSDRPDFGNFRQAVSPSSSAEIALERQQSHGKEPAFRLLPSPAPSSSRFPRPRPGSGRSR